MTRLKYIVTTVAFLFFIALIYRALLLLADLSSMFANTETITEVITFTENNTLTKNSDIPSIPVNNNSGNFETIEETIARLKRDVIVTGTILDTSGQESAFFHIEGMPDRAFKINTQLMDGFIIKEITKSYVVLKNQVGNEIFSLYVQSAKASLDNTETEPGPGLNRAPMEQDTQNERNTLNNIELERRHDSITNPDQYNPQQFTNSDPEMLYDSGQLENPDQDFYLQDETRSLENIEREGTSNSMKDPDRYDAQQFQDGNSGTTYYSEQPENIKPDISLQSETGSLDNTELERRLNSITDPDRNDPYQSPDNNQEAIRYSE